MIKSWIAPLLIAVCLSPRASALTDDELRGYAIETAENYRLSDGTIRSLKRLAGTIFIQIDNAEAKELVFEQITGAGGVLEGYTPEEGGISAPLLHECSKSRPRPAATESRPHR